MTTKKDLARAKELDQFYTVPQRALEATGSLLDILTPLGYRLDSLSILEPSAGAGAFVDAATSVFPHRPVIALDLDPHDPRCRRADFLADDLGDLPHRDDLIVLGNPPYGKRSDLALAFVDRGFDIADTVAFVLPVQFRKHLTQRRIRSDARLVVDVDMPKDSFTFADKNYHVNSCFQVWTLRDGLTDLRVRDTPPISHPDFIMWCYNATPQAEKYFDEDWDIAVPLQSWGDFSPVMRSQYDSGEVELPRRKQWMFYSASSPEVLSRLLDTDFATLAQRNTSVSGFGKADFVADYLSRYSQ